MTRIDILLGGLPKTYEIVVDKNNHHDIICDKGHHSYDVNIYNLTDRQGIYGDELTPLIFHLTESNIDCFIGVDMLQEESYNNLSLESNRLQISKQTYALLKKQIAKLKTNAEISFVKTADVETNNLTLSSSGEITNISHGRPKQSSARLVSQITDNLSKVVELMLNASGVHWFDGYLYEYDDMLLSEMDLTYPKMSLVTSCGKMYMKFSFDIEKSISYLGCNIADFIAYVNLKETIRNNLNLTADIPFSYQIICSCNPMFASLETPEMSVKVIAYSTPEDIVMEFTDWITQDVRTETALGVTSQSKLNTSITDEMEAYYGLGRYDNRYLYSWDDYTVYDMGAEIINQNQSGSVDM